MPAKNGFFVKDHQQKLNEGHKRWREQERIRLQDPEYRKMLDDLKFERYLKRKNKT